MRRNKEPAAIHNKVKHPNTNSFQLQLIENLMKEFDLIHSPLEGVNLIEASAGTGKTYAIEGLFIRLIIEKQLGVDQILVVTFTKAATEELKGRIRNKLLELKSAFSGKKSEDGFIDSMVKSRKDSAESLKRITDALVEFDRARIFTIHGFCQRVLFEHAFETGSLFDTELLTDPSALKREVADDFWRKMVSGIPPEFASYLDDKNIKGPEFFERLLLKAGGAGIKIVPDTEKPSLKSLDKIRKIFTALQFSWPVARGRVEGLLKSKSLDGRAYGAVKPDSNRPEFTKRDLKVTAMVKAMDSFLAQDHFTFPMFKDFEKFTATKLAEYTLKNQSVVAHDFFELSDDLLKALESLTLEMEDLLVYYKQEFFPFSRFSLQTKKKNGNSIVYEDLLTMVMNALRGTNKLAAAIRKQYRAALVDEFQDTDPIQYEIFSRLFASNDSILFIIGDPKQAIYSFRGADIFSYMDAAAEADSKHTLLKNWRSEPGLITAVNTLFSNVNKPFIFNRITFEKGKPGTRVEPVVSKESVPLVFWFLKSEKATKLLSKNHAVKLIGRAVAREISNVLSEQPRTFQEKDIAVIVRTNRQARIVKHHLSQLHVPSVLYNAGNIYDSRESLEVERILSSLADPSNPRLFRAALTTDTIGFSGEKMGALDEENPEIEKKHNAFMEYSRIWRLQGFIRMFRTFMAGERIGSRLLALPDGERRLTNLLHLMEILHHEDVEKKPGMTGLAKWLAGQRNSPFSETEENQLRLESDEQAVKIITIHKSKGLEYPVVFCPFGWETSRTRGEEVLFHDIKKDGTWTFDLAPNQHPDHIRLAELELLSENLRLLYVAVTRAQKRCYLVWGRINTAESSALSYLVSAVSGEKENKGFGQDLIDSLCRNFKVKNDDDLYNELKLLENKSNQTIQVRPLPQQEFLEPVSRKKDSVKLSHRKFSGKIKKNWKILSYSALISNRERDFDPTHYDVHASPERTAGEYKDAYHDRTDQTDANDIFSFPKGPRAGIFFPDIFEHLDFTNTDRTYRSETVSAKLNEYGFDPKWEGGICQAIDNVLSVPLRKNGNALLLSSLRKQDRINEMEFYFPLKPFTPERLSDIFKTNRRHIFQDFPLQMERLAFKPSKGFMKGYIDLVFCVNRKFYIVDWKTNFLGTRVKDYAVEFLNQSMEKDFYTVQYHIYVLALHQYLKTRLQHYCYQVDFGGVFYIFIRGVNPDFGPEYGIFYDRPSGEFIDELGQLLIPDY